MSNIVAWNFN